MQKEVEKYLRLKRKLIVLEYARVFGSKLSFLYLSGLKAGITVAGVTQQ